MATQVATFMGDVLTPAQWARLAELDARIKARDQERRDHLLERLDRELEAERKHYTAADRAYHEWCDRVPHGPSTIGAVYASRFLRIPLDTLLEATKDEQFTIAFGKSWTGGLLVFFRYKELVRWAKARLRGRPAGLRPSLAA